MNKTNHHVQIAEPIEGRAINFHKLIFIKPRTSHVNVGKVAYSARDFLLASIRACTSWIETRSLLILRLTNSPRQVSAKFRTGIERDVEVWQSTKNLLFWRILPGQIRFCITRMSWMLLLIRWNWIVCTMILRTVRGPRRDSWSFSLAEFDTEKFRFRLIAIRIATYLFTR